MFDIVPNAIEYIIFNGKTVFSVNSLALKQILCQHTAA